MYAIAIEEVFSYSGNAWRGQLRDLAASYMLDALGSPTLSLDAFHLLYSGGRIGQLLSQGGQGVEQYCGVLDRAAGLPSLVCPQAHTERASGLRL
jgi:hypothetical protein